MFENINILDKKDICNGVVILSQNNEKYEISVIWNHKKKYPEKVETFSKMINAFQYFDSYKV